METKIVLCPNCRIPNASGVSNCRGCGIRLCCQCNSAMPLQLGVCPQCGWWDPSWKPPYRDSEKDESEQRPTRVFTKKLEFQCTQCGANVAHDAEKCTICGYVGHMQLRQNKSSVTANRATTAIRNNSAHTKHNSFRIGGSRPVSIRSDIKTTGNFSKNKNRANIYKSTDHNKEKTATKAVFWGYETKKSFSPWLLIAIIASAVIFIVLTVLLFIWLGHGNL